MRTPQEVAEGIRNLFANFSQNWIIVIEAVFLFLIIYFVLKILYENNAKKLIPVYVLLIVCAGAVSLFSRDLTTGVYYIFILLISLFFLLLFSVEIKRSIWNRTKRTIVSSSDAAAKNTAVSARADEYITNIVKAVQALSKSNTGALTFPRRLCMTARWSFTAIRFRRRGAFCPSRRRTSPKITAPVTARASA